MFDEKTLKQTEKLMEQYQQALNKRYEGKDFTTASGSGIPIKPVYTPSDVKDLDYEKDIGVPGLYPYMRSNYPIHYQFQPWINQPVHGYGLPEHTRERMDMLAEAGMEGHFGGRSYNIVCDIPTHFGVDPDEPDAQGYIGKDGVSCPTDEDFGRMLHGIDLTKTNIVLINRDTLPYLSHFIAYAESQGLNPSQLRGNTMNWQFGVWYAPNQLWDSEGGLKLATEVIWYCCKEMPKWNHTNIQGHGMSETGANAVQQMAYAIATAMTIADSCKAAGLDPDTFMPGIGYQIAQCNEFFEYICMFRAWRKLWANIARERYGCKKPSSMMLRTHSHTSCFELTRQQPLVNVIRSSYHALGAVLSGTTAMEVPAYDEPIGLPTEESAILSLRIQQVIRHETGVTKVSDPLAGSYYVESLTNRMEQEAREILKEIDDAGGFIKAHKNGMFMSEMRKNAAEWRKKIDRGEKIVVGWNKYTVPEKDNFKAFRADPAVARIAAERIKAYKANRDQAKTDAALNALVEAAERLDKGEYGHVMPACIEAARAKATTGEISKNLRKVFKWGPQYNMALQY
ncbi:methylmalonyl-CoA mutase family protein [Thermodesulfobacteriota bacterium]